jgi:large subunit ribosomal protein L23
MTDPYDIIIMPWITEKTLEARRVADEENGYRENNNRIEFIVHKDATKKQIRESVEQMFDVKVRKVNTKFTMTGKHASVRLAEGYDAEEAALKLGAF